jgi:hypothetical protein
VTGYPTPKEITKAWRYDEFRNVNYFFNNRHYGISTFQDDEILSALQIAKSAFAPGPLDAKGCYRQQPGRSTICSGPTRGQIVCGGCDVTAPDRESASSFPAEPEQPIGSTGFGE